MKVLVLTAMYPTAARPAAGTFVKEQVDSLVRAGINVDVMAFEGGRSLASYVRAGLALRRRLKTEHYDLIHAHYGLTGLPARMQFSCPVVLTYHGSDILGEVGRNGRYTLGGRLKVLLSKSLGCVVRRRIIVARLLRNRWWDATVIPMGVDMEKFRPGDRDAARRQLGLAPEHRYVLFVANPGNPVKRHDLAKAAVDIVRGEDASVELLAVHDVPHDQVPVFMNAGDVLVLTSDHEASPCVIKEALASNLPIVSVAVGDVAERTEGVAGCWICDRTPEALAAGLLAALRHGGPTTGREKVREVSLEDTARQTIAVYEAAVRR